jgi:hypothetical protein
MSATLRMIKPLSSLRLWLVVFALLFSQWIFANHEHEEELASGETCQVCLLASHFDTPLTSDSTLFSPVFDYAEVTVLYSIANSPFCPDNTARAPPYFSLI